MHRAVVGNPDALAAQLEHIGTFAQFPGRGNLAEPLDERRDLGGNVDPRIELVRDQPGAGIEMEAPRLASGPPAELGIEPEIVAVQERRQEQGHLQAVLGGRAEEAQRAVDLEGVAVGHRSLHPVDKPVELEPAEELAIARGALVANLCLHPDRTQQDRLRQGDVVAIDQPLRRHVLELEQPVLISQVGEEGLQHGFRRELELLGDRREHLVAAKGWSGCQADLGFLRPAARPGAAGGLRRPR